jgi:hypothetical protein
MPNSRNLTGNPILGTQFTTYDLGASAALVALGFSLLEIRKQLTSKSLFVFENSKDLIDVAQNYWRRNLVVDALTYFNSIKALKNQLYSN